MNTFNRLCNLGLLLFLLMPLPTQAATISSLTPTFKQVNTAEGLTQIMIRTFRKDGKAMALVVNPLTLATTMVVTAEITETNNVIDKDTPYLRTLRDNTAGPVRLQNHGLRHAAQQVNGQFLTVDLCPSKRPFEQSLFEEVANSGQKWPVPVAVAITGSWLATHEQEFTWLRQQERTGKLAITWVNHSLTHPFDSKVTLAQTFLLTPGLDQRHEILDFEKILLERGVVPSPFFRFPGLVADAATMVLVRKLGLIPLGSDAWLAKGELSRAGSIILVHGNGNEPAGISKFADLQRSGKLLTFLPLAQSVVAVSSFVN